MHAHYCDIQQPTLSFTPLRDYPLVLALPFDPYTQGTLNQLDLESSVIPFAPVQVNYSHSANTSTIVLQGDHYGRKDGENDHGGTVETSCNNFAGKRNVTARFTCSFHPLTRLVSVKQDFGIFCQIRRRVPSRKAGGVALNSRAWGLLWRM